MSNFPLCLPWGNQHSKLCSPCARAADRSDGPAPICPCTYDKDRTLANLRRKGFMVLVQVILNLLGPRFGADLKGFNQDAAIVRAVHFSTIRPLWDHPRGSNRLTRGSCGAVAQLLLPARPLVFASPHCETINALEALKGR